MKQKFHSRLLSWGRIPSVQNQTYMEISSPCVLPSLSPMLPRGEGRSYGDSCVNENGILLGTKNLNFFLGFNPETGVLKAQAGVTLDEILKVFVPKGWFLPVTPGTKFVTLGGAVANDVHGKNHHKLGNFGNHVLSFELLKSDRKSYFCSLSSNEDLFRATIGGLGLTGLITWVEIKLIPIKSAYIDQEQIKFTTLSEFMKLSKESENNFDYTVAWVDCINGNELRGIFIRGNHAKIGPLEPHKDPWLVIPFNLPTWTLNKVTISLFNFLYYAKNFKKKSYSRIHYDSFFYPLDSIHHWNRIYGSHGFYQYQFVVPFGRNGERALGDILRKIKDSGMASFLVVLKTFGDVSSPGMLSFPKEGITLALDFPNYGKSLLKLLEECDAILETADGRVYPAKDARMSASFFSKGYNKDSFLNFNDSHFSSSFSRRVNL